MLAVKGYYQDGEFTLLEPLPDHVREAELNIIVLPREEERDTSPSAESFKAIGLRSFFETEDDADVDWKDWLGLK